MKRNLLTLITILAGITVVGLIREGFLRTQPAQAQQTASSSNIVKQRWEYCVIVDSYGMDDSSGKPAVGFTSVCYFDESGYREETAKVQGETSGIQPTEVYEKARQKALSVTIAQLGSRGWEMVGEFPFTKRFHSDEKDRPGLYFKRGKP